MCKIRGINHTFGVVGIYFWHAWHGRHTLRLYRFMIAQGKKNCAERGPERRGKLYPTFFYVEGSGLRTLRALRMYHMRHEDTITIRNVYNINETLHHNTHYLAFHP